MANHFAVPAHVVVGTGALAESGKFMKTYGGKALIVTGKHVVKSEMMTELKGVLDDCGIAYVVFDGITISPFEPPR